MTTNRNLIPVGTLIDMICESAECDTSTALATIAGFASATLTNDQVAELLRMATKVTPTMKG